MVHRPADSRLLTNLLTHEKDYTKHLSSLLDHSHASLASFQAYASASSPPTSHVILAVTASLAGADDALARYSAAVDDCRNHFKALKALEDEVGNIMRDREILVTRLIKASKSHKPTRDSLLLYHPPPANSSSSLSLHSNFSGGSGLPSSAKLSAAQAELQACEAQLAVKERDLALGRNRALREGLSVRCRAMVDCGWVWGEMGKEALRALEGLVNDAMANGNGHPITGQEGSRTVEGPYQHALSNRNGPPTSPPSSRPGSQFFPSTKPLPDPNLGSDLSSIAPSQSASQTDLALPPPIPSSSEAHKERGSEYGYNAYVSPPGSSQQHGQILVPPAHAISDADQGRTFEFEPAAPSTPGRHVLARRITEEELHTAPSSEEGEGEGEGSSAGEEEPEGGLQVVENPRFAAKKEKRASTTSVAGDRSTSARPATPPPASPKKAGFGILGWHGVHAHPTAQTPESSPSPGKRARKVSGSTTSSSPGFFGSLSRMFGHHRPSASTSALPAAFYEAPGSADERKTHRFGLGGGKGGRWETRTERNLRELRSGEGSDEEEDRGKGGGVSAAMSMGAGLFVPMSTSMSTTPSTPTPKPRPARRASVNGRERVVSDTGAGAKNVPDSPPSPSPGRRLKKRPAGAKEKGKEKETAQEREREKEKEKEKSQSQDEQVGKGKKVVGRKRSASVPSVFGGASSPVTAPTATTTATTPAATPITTTSPAPPATQTGLTRKKSVGRKTAAGGGAGAAAGEGAVTLSRNSSLMSTASAPPGLLSSSSPGRRGKAKARGGPAPTQATSASASGTTYTPSKLGTVTTNKPTQFPQQAPKPTHTHARATSLTTAEGEMNLLSIVEDVVRGNREGWSSGAGGGVVRKKSVGGSVVVVPASSAGGGGGQPKQPEQQKKGQQEQQRGRVPTPTRTQLEVPRAPGSVFDQVHAAASTSGVQEKAPVLLSPTPQTPIRTGERRPAKSPLRSALRNPSRTPSPLPYSQMEVPPLPSVPNGASIQAGPHAPAPPTGQTGVEDVGRGVEKGKGKDVVNEDQDDTASLSSYETGREVFFDANEDLPPPPTQQYGSAYSSQPQSQPQPQPQPQSQSPPQVPNGTAHPGASDLSATTSASTSADGHPPPVPEHDGQGGQQQQVPRRRKSVRVSLQPTFSPTPPAIEYDYEKDEGEHRPWSAGAGTKGSGKDERGDGGRGGKGKKSEHVEVQDLWEDSSEEDEEYSRARRLLNRVGRKEGRK